MRSVGTAAAQASTEARRFPRRTTVSLNRATASARDLLGLGLGCQCYPRLNPDGIPVLPEAGLPASVTSECPREWRPNFDRGARPCPRGLSRLRPTLALPTGSRLARPDPARLEVAPNTARHHRLVDSVLSGQLGQDRTTAVRRWRLGEGGWQDGVDRGHLGYVPGGAERLGERGPCGVKTDLFPGAYGVAALGDRVAPAVLHGFPPLLGPHSVVDVPRPRQTLGLLLGHFAASAAPSAESPSGLPRHRSTCRSPGVPSCHNLLHSGVTAERLQSHNTHTVLVLALTRRT